MFILCWSACGCLCWAWNRRLRLWRIATLSTGTEQTQGELVTCAVDILKRRFTSVIQKHHSPQNIGRNITRLRTEQVRQAVRIVWTSFTDDTTVTSYIVRAKLLTKCAIDSRQRYFTVNSMAKLYEGMTRNGARNCENKWSANCYKICTYSLSVVEVNTKNHTNKLISLYSFSYIYIYIYVCVYVCMYKAYICFLMPMFFCFFTSFQ